jgi:hypothetical protein
LILPAISFILLPGGVNMNLLMLDQLAAAIEARRHIPIYGLNRT